MKSQEILKICLRELRRCALSFLLIILGVFLATRNAPATEPSPNQNKCMNGLETVTALVAQPIDPGNRALVQSVGNNLGRFPARLSNSKCAGNHAIAHGNRKSK